MDTETKLSLITGVGEEIITPEELKKLLETKTHPIAYDGFEPSGLAHLPFGIYRPLLLKDLLKAGIRFKLFLADWHAAINNKMGGDLEKIKKVGEYFIEVWKAAGVDFSKVTTVWASDLCSTRDYWERVIRIAKHTSVKRATRALSIMGRKEGELLEVAQYFYPAMQTADIFELGVDMTQLGLDQRRANILARELAPKLEWKKPVVVSHHMLMGLSGKKEPEGFADEKRKDIEIASKMSKSKPSSAVFVHDSKKIIEQKINAAFCEPKNVENNPLLDYSKEIIFRAQKEMKIARPSKYGGDISFGSYQEIEHAFRKGTLHPLDLKRAVAAYLDMMIVPLRSHFEKNSRAKRLYEEVKKQEITR
jgi:tyrosyl-tRNA synthetase